LEALVNRLILIIPFVAAFTAGFFLAASGIITVIPDRTTKTELEQLHQQLAQLQQQLYESQTHVTTQTQTITTLTAEKQKLTKQMADIEQKFALNKQELTLWTERITSCSNKPTELSKSSCFERIASYVQANEGQEGSNSLWSIHSSRPAESDLADVQLQSKAIKAFADKQHLQTTPSMILFCKSQQSTVALAWNRALDQGYHTLTAQLDDAPPVEQRWQVDVSGTTLVYYDDPKPFIETMLNHKRVTFQFKTTKTDFVATFDVEGLRSELEALTDSCGWQSMASL
jgi:uncharacterized membrane-anchored protein YhcB (DUF1043 family)